MTTRYISPILNTMNRNLADIVAHNQYTLNLTACQNYRGQGIIITETGQVEGCENPSFLTPVGTRSSFKCAETGDTVYHLVLEGNELGGSAVCRPGDVQVIYTFGVDPLPPSYCTVTSDSELCYFGNHPV
ncbi:MAG: hypothetical protein Q8Q33_08880 [Chlamydiota bacterium]|nr:hypothetical protein [Chlamydiota bacterium]